ncbi:MAG TPA: VWA domain-containing protein, partial [Ilumatobacteraceae bacterium]|nr:VWA domain-containing protein [Ilumatobacteraceae bacterium]
MSFLSPGMLVLLALVPLGIVVYRRVDSQRRARAAELASMGFGAAPGTRRNRAPHLPAAIFLTALALMAVAAARPQLKVGLPHRQGTVILAFDASNSMQATDLQPTRMDAAKTAAKEFIDAQPSSIKIGVVAFNNGALVTQQPTSDRPDAVAAIDRLTSAGATSLGQGIFASLSAIAGKPLSLPENATVDDVANVDIGFYGSA